LRKYWKSKGINYRCIIEIKEAVEKMVNDTSVDMTPIYVKQELSKCIYKSYGGVTSKSPFRSLILFSALW